MTHSYWATCLALAAAMTSGGWTGFLNFLSLERSIASCVALVALERTSLEVCKTTEYKMLETGLDQDSKSVSKVGTRSLLYSGMPVSDQRILCFVLVTSGAVMLSMEARGSPILNSVKSERITSCLESTRELDLQAEDICDSFLS